MVDTSSWLTRNEAADMLCMSANTIGNYERRGKLHPVTAIRADRHGTERRVLVYNPQELAKLPRLRNAASIVREPGEVAARCFELLDQGRTVREVVIELRETPEQISRLRESWLDAGGADITINPMAKEALEKILGPFSSIADLVQLITLRIQRA